MGNIDVRLLAQSYDPNQTGYVTLNNQDPALGKPGAKVSVAALDGALGRDEIVISGDTIEARKPGQPTTVASLSAVSLALKHLEALMWSRWPDRYQTVAPRTGQPTYDWQGAIGVYQEGPAQPGVTVSDMADDVSGTQQAIQELRSELADPHLKGIQGRAQQALQQAQGQDNPLNNILWALGPGNDSGYGNGPAQTVSAIQDGLSALKQANPAALESREEALAQKAYRVEQESWGVRTTSDAQQLADDAKAVSEQAQQIQTSATGATDAIQGLLDNVS